MNGNNRIEFITMREMQSIRRGGNTMLIDVRDREEYQTGHLRGAVNYPYAELNTWKNTLPQDKDIILYCDYGNLSMQTARKLPARKGKIYTLAGGIKD